MTGLVRLILIWLIVAAIPLKGLAAMTMLGCGPAGHHSPRGSAEVVQHQTNGDILEVRKGVRADHAKAGNEGDESAANWSPDHSKQLKVKCSSCAPCCSVAAPAPEQARISQAESVSTAVAFLEIRFPAIFADVPHRPPRLTLA